jgi:hypothetical protein
MCIINSNFELITEIFLVKVGMFPTFVPTIVQIDAKVALNA